jgi:hypothetical protein
MSWPIQLAGNGMACIAGSDDGNVYYFAPLRLLGRRRGGFCIPGCIRMFL